MTAECQTDDCKRSVDKRGYCEMHYMRLYRRGEIRKRTTEERFWAKVDKAGACWEWTGGKVPSGYGAFKKKSREGDREGTPAHRFAYEQMVGPIPDGLLIDHKCHNRACVNPSHLRLATSKQNAENLAGLRVDNTSGYRGAHFHPGAKRWRGLVQHNKKSYLAGWFDTPEEAAEAARQLRLSLFSHNDADRQTKN